ncbi:MAG: hypothetical protein IPG11_05265 [Flavobacteriales bacterium]|nr:hypothetical protein [Flavobacteriales bacterium]
MLRDFLRNSFLARVLRTDRALGFFFALFVAIQLLAQVLTAEVTPFFLYGMYSDPIHPSPTYVRMTCEADGEPVSQEDLPRYAGELFFSTLYRLEALEAAQGADLFEPFINERLGFLPGPLKGRLVRDLSFDPANKPALGAWMSRYLSRSLHRPVNSVVIAREAYRYENARPVRISTEVLLRH